MILLSIAVAPAQNALDRTATTVKLERWRSPSTGSPRERQSNSNVIAERIKT